MAVAPPQLDNDPPAARNAAANAHAAVAALAGPRLYAAIGLAVAALAAGAAWMLAGGDELTPHEQVQIALQLMQELDNPAARQQALGIVRHLNELKFRDPEFAGAQEYILGMIAFRDAGQLDDASREQQDALAVRNLREAEKRALDAAYRPQWAYALGSSLHRMGSAAQARPLLEEALASYPDAKIDISMLLIGSYLDMKTPEVLQSALTLSDELLGQPSLPAGRRSQLLLQRAQALLALGRQEEAEEALAKLREISSGAAEDHGTVVFHAQTLMAERRFDQAIQVLRPVAESVGLDQTFIRQALYLMGVCAEELQQVDNAINYFERTADRYEQSHEGLAANLRAADLLRSMGRTEEALNKRYLRALKLVKGPDDYRNRWITIESFRERILAAWTAWVDAREFAAAIALSKMMPPLFAERRGLELTAQATERWARHLQSEYDKARFSERQKLKPGLLERWRASGQAYAALADTLTATAQYSDVLWISAEHFQHGHDFDSSLAQITRFINTRPDRLMAQALVRRGQVLMDLDRLDEALEHFERAIVNYPTDPAAFDAAYAIGVCRLEQNELELAAQAWRKIVEDHKLTPDADVWKLSLFSLGRLLYHDAAMLLGRADRPGRQNSADNAPSQPALETAFERYAEAIRRLDEFLERYPDHEHAIEAQFLLARAMQQHAGQPRRKLETAETENARLELRRAVRELLSQARDEFRTLRGRLLDREAEDQLDELGQQILQDCFFELAHTEYALEDFEQAIVSYTTAANKYPLDPQVLLAYLQMTNCYDRLQKPVDARSMIEQAKVILKNLPDEVFDPRRTNMSRQEWDEWLKLMGKLHQSDSGSTP